MEDISLHILDIAENALVAGANLVEIGIAEDTDADLFTVRMRDNGRGMDTESLKRVTDPFFTTKEVRRVGLGVPLLRQAAEECDGSFSIVSRPGSGTTVTARFRRSHIDRKPLGDVAATMVVLVAGNPDVDFVMSYAIDGYSYRLDTREVRAEIGDIPMNTPSVLAIIREDIRKGIEGGLSSPERSNERNAEEGTR